MRKEIIEIIMGFLLLIATAIISINIPKEEYCQTLSENTQVNQQNLKTVVIDAGHGGNDPGKIGIDKSLEKDINLDIAKKIKKYLSMNDIFVVLTREKDVSLASSDSGSKKMSDMRERCRIIDKAAPQVVVSIHQNSYHQEAINGGQVFYYKNSEKGKKLSKILQHRFDFVLGTANRRTEKPNDSYYLLLHVKCPIAIVECGFLSNWEEAKKLNSEEYKDRMAFTISMGIIEYLNSK